jgi:hypothetical protein
MLLKNIKALVACSLILLGASTSAFASHTVYVQETFTSGAAFNGSLTFSDNYLVLQGGTGTLSGLPGSPITLNQTWFGGVLDGSVVPGAFGETGHDFLMDVLPNAIGGGATHYFIGFIWKLSAGDLGLLTDTTIFPLYSSLSVYSDLAGYAYDDVLTATVSLEAPTPPTTNPIPEPGSVLLLGAGIAALVGMRRRKAA